MSSFLNLRFMAILIFAIVFVVLFYYYNDSLDAIVALEREKSKCQQGADTLSAQLQVVYEHKSRLEKSLQLEKSNLQNYKTEQEKLLTSARQAHDKLRKQFNETKADRDKLLANFNELKRKHDDLTAATHSKVFDAENKNSLLQQQIDELTQRLAVLKAENLQHLQIIRASRVGASNASVGSGSSTLLDASWKEADISVLQKAPENGSTFSLNQMPALKRPDDQEEVVFKRRPLPVENGVLPPPAFRRSEADDDDDNAAEKPDPDLVRENVLLPPKNVLDAVEQDLPDAADLNDDRENA